MDKQKKNSPFRIFLRKFLKQKLAVFAFGLVIAIVLVGIFGPLFSPYDPHRPVTAQYPDMGIDLEQLTSLTLEIEGLLSNGETIEQQELTQIQTETDDRRIAAVRRSQSGIRVSANSSGYTDAIVESGDVSAVSKVLVRGEIPLDDAEPTISQIRINQPDASFSEGDSYQIEVSALLTDGTEITSLDNLKELAEELYGEEEEEDTSGFQSSTTNDDDAASFQINSLTEDTVSVDEDGVVSFESDGEGLVQIQAGEAKSLVQFQVGPDSIEPVLTSLVLQSTTIELNDAYKHQSPSSLHLFGTDHQNRDILSRVIHGTKETLLIGFVSVAIGTVIGTVLGLLAGYYGGWLDSLVTRMTDVLLAFPGILLAIAVIAFLGAGITNIIFAVAVFTIPVFIRIVRASTLSLKEMTYVEAAKSIGVPNTVIIFRHIFPGTLSVVMVYLTMRIGVAILIGAALSFLGLGGDITAPEWGSMLSAAKDNSGTIFHATFFPGLAIVITVLSFNIFGDGLRDALDPKLKE
ncbi:ABC transporter permease [Salipaludibacillus daqingensis]|uniref:ABC transporter permease n=1 Tax=Salipaludibacillus daqingensis TaxID=3041001 RepID=UPI0024756D49|nr:ABC transporter permease subunit [Salipaludibacillus daqingensis]